MSEQSSSQEKTEEASQQKLKKGKSDGQVARSKDLATAVSLIATLFVLKYTLVFFYETLHESFRLSYPDLTKAQLNADTLPLMLGHNMALFTKLLLPLLLVPLLVVVSSLVPGGWIFSAKNFYPKFSKLNPLTGLARMVSAQNWSELFKSILKIIVLLSVARLLINDAIPSFTALQRTDLLTAIGGSFSLMFNMTLQLLLVFVLFSFIDIPLQRFFFMKKMRMTKQERKEEHKTQEGRPEVKARIKQIQRQMLQRQISRVLKKADVIIVNPQHYAVALKYDPQKAQAPFVIAKGVDEMALYIRKMATTNLQEIIEMPPLARAIYFSTQVNQQIPAPLYTAVAHVLTYVLQLRAYRQGRRNKPQLATNINIPDSMANRTQS
jgi:flagellar biosynthetic protein FlhB